MVFKLVTRIVILTRSVIIHLLSVGPLFILLANASGIYAQSEEAGLPFIKNFTPREYNANTQNWAIVEDNRGVMYFGNNKGVLEFDGVNWSTIPISNNSIARSLAVNSEGTIFVGGVGDFGYLAPDDDGKLVYHSLIHKLTEPERAFSDIWSTLVKDDEVYFQSFNFLYRYKNGEIKSWSLNNSYHRSFIVHDQLYFRQDDPGLVVLKNDSIIAVPGGEYFKSEFISAMLPYENNILIGTRQNGLFLYDLENQQLRKFDTELNELLRAGRVYHGIVLPDGNYAFATLEDGLFVMNKEGEQVLHINETSGLQYQLVYNLFCDRSGSLWLGLANGISKIEVISPITLFNHISGLSGGILDVIRFEGRLYVSTHESVFYLNDHGRFEQVKGLQVQCWRLLTFDVPSQPGQQKLLVGASDGVYEIKDNIATRVFTGRVGEITTSELYPDRIFVGMIGTIISLRYENDQWVKEAETQIPQNEIRSMISGHDGNLWIGTMYGGAYRLKMEDWKKYISGGITSDADLTKSYGVEDGIPILNWNYFYDIDGEILVTTRKGIYKYNNETDHFEKHQKIDQAFKNEERWIYYINKDENGNLWFDSDKGKGMLVKNSDGYELQDNQFKSIIVSPENQVTGYTDKNGILWFGTPDGLFRYDSKFEKNYTRVFHALIRKIIIGTDSVIFNGAYYQQPSGSNAMRSTAFEQPASLAKELEYSSNSLSFHFSAPIQENEDGNVYSYYLDGYDQNWSGWSKETKKEYTNLSEGSYTFKVRARNIYDSISKEASYSFAILPPWYRTSYAYVLYIFMSIGFMYIVVNRYSEKLKKDNLRLESIVQNRTAEISRQKEKIEKQKNTVEKSYKNLTTLSQIGQSITSTLDLKSIISTLYKSINTLMASDSFGVGIYNEDTQTLHFRYSYENGQELPAFYHETTATDKLAVWCLKNRKEIFINDLKKEFINYIPQLNSQPTTGSSHSESLIYLPIMIKTKVIGVISVQSFEKNAYEPFHLDILRTLAAYTAIALDNSYAYLRLNEINEELMTTLEDLKKTQTQLVQSEKMASLGQLTAGVAHEINNPINFVSAGIDSLSINYQDLSEIIQKYATLQKDSDNAEILKEIDRLKKELDLEYLLTEIPQLLSSIKSGATRTTEIIKSLRNFTRLDEDSLKKADINEGLDSTLVILRNQLSDKVEVIKEYADIPAINCYPGQLNQVFMNILNNAIQAVEGNGKITIRTLQENGSVMIKIRDTGKGMSEDLKNRIFEPFFTTKDVGEGTGLGLSISYGIIEKHQGKIEVESTPGEGTEFIIQLPQNLN